MRLRFGIKSKLPILSQCLYSYDKWGGSKIFNGRKRRAIQKVQVKNRRHFSSKVLKFEGHLPNRGQND